MRHLVYITTLFCITSLLSCTQNEKKHDKGIFIVTTTGMIQDAIQHIVGDSAEVVALIGPGNDPHQYRAVQSDMSKLEKADIIFYNGLHLEGKMANVFENLSKSKDVYAFSNGLNETDIRHSAELDAHDPHIWFDVSIWIKCIEHANKVLIQKYPQHKSYFETNCESYLNELNLLHAKCKSKISEIPREQRVLITAHDAFGYFGDAYDIEVKGLQGISTVSEPGLKSVQELKNLIIEREIKALFVETSVPQGGIKRLIESCEESGYQVKIGGNLYSDAMGDKGTKAEFYTGMVNENLETIVNALK